MRASAIRSLSEHQAPRYADASGQPACRRVGREIDELGAHLYEKPMDGAGLLRIGRALLDGPPAVMVRSIEGSSTAVCDQHLTDSVV